MSAEVLKELSNREKAALLFLCMDEESASQVFNYLEDSEIKKAGSALLTLSQVPSTQIQNVLDEFLTSFDKAQHESEKQDFLPKEIKVNGKHVVQKMMNQALPQKRGQTILQNLGSNAPVQASEQADLQTLIQEYSTEKLFEITRNEHPQMVATILLYAKKKVAKEVIQKFAPEIQAELFERMAHLNVLSARVVEDLRGFLIQSAKSQAQAGDQGIEASVVQDESVSGIEHTLKLLKSMPRDQAMAMIESIEKLDPEMGAQISKRIFTIEDLERADDSGIRELLKGIRNDDLKVALKNVATSVQDKFFKNMSERAAMILREDMEVLPPLKVEEIEEAQNGILKVAKNLMKEEKLRLEEVKDEE